MIHCSQCDCLLPEDTLQCPNCHTSLKTPSYSPPNPAPAYRQNYDPAPAMSGLAIAAFVVSLFGLMIPCIVPLVALILGIVALVQINNNVGRLKGGGFAIAGIVIAGLSFILLPAILFPVFARAREKARQTSCLSKQKEIATAIMMYAQDNNGVLPPPSQIL